MHRGIPKTDPFSYTMPSYPVVDHEWLTDVVIFKLYPVIQMWGLSALAATLTLLALLISLPQGINKWSVIPLLLSFTVIVFFVGVRPQVETWFFLAVLLKIALNQNLWKKWRFVIPIFFLIWVNLHGGFAIGIVVLFIILIIRFWQQKRLNAGDLLVLLSSILTTFLNPYGARIWWEVWMTISDGSIRWSIQEWAPMIFRVDPPYLLLLSLSSLMVWRYRRKFKLIVLVVFIILGLAGISSQRHIPLWLLIVLPVTTLCLQYFYEDIKENLVAVKRFNLIYKIFLAGTIIISASWLFLVIQGSRQWSESKWYPKDAVSFLKNYPPKARIFAPYNWGGYLVWSLPEQKVFIDGRMPTWRWTPPDSNESSWAYKDFNRVLDEEKTFDEVFLKYNINTVIGEAPLKKEENVVQNLQIKLDKLLGIKYPRPLLERLQKAGWKKIYQDSVAVIFQKS